MEVTLFNTTYKKRHILDRPTTDRQGSASYIIDKRRQHTQHITDRQRCCRSGSRRSSYKCYNAEVTMVQEGVVTVQHAVTTVTGVCATYQDKRMQP